MPLRRTQYEGEFDLPAPPPGQVANTQITALAQLVVFEFPDTNVDCFEVYTCVERQWKLRETLLDVVQQKFTQARSPDDIHPEHLPVAAGILTWLGSFERWLESSFLYEIFEDLGEAHDRTKAEGHFHRAFLLGMFALLYDKAFEALREFFTDIHYTHYPEDEPTALQMTDWQVYVASSDLIISAASDQECLVRKREDDVKLTWWDHRRLILEDEPDQREGVSWLWQDREEMEEMARRYPEAAMLTRRPFMMPVVQFR
jgi:hypothetical protein